MAELPDTLPGHWLTSQAREMAVRHIGQRREDLTCGDQSDFELANSVFLAGRSDLNLIGLQTAAKERIRWLSVQLAIAQAALQPFADEGRLWLTEADCCIADDEPVADHVCHSAGWLENLTAGDLRRAARALPAKAVGQ